MTNSKIKTGITVALTTLLSFFSLIAIIIAAKAFGFSSSDFHNPTKTFDPLTLITTLGVLIVPVFLTIAAQKLILKMPLSTLGLNDAFSKMFFTGAFFGLVLKAFATAGALAFSWQSVKVSVATIDVGFIGWIPYFVWFLIALLLNSLNEELVYRVFPIRNILLTHKVNPIVLVLITASLFSGIHFLIETPSILKFLYRFGFGLLAGILYLKRSSLWQIVGLHTGWNFAALAISDTDWRTGTLLTVTGLESGAEEIMNCLILAIASIYFLTGNRQRT